MDNKNITLQAAMAAGCDAQQAQALADAFASAIRDRCAQLDTVAIPGFGSFIPEKKDEYVTTESDGRRILMPPHISMSFKPGSMLRKHLPSNE